MLKKIVNIFRSSNLTPKLLHTTDLHSHLLPGIDDGVKSFDESLELLKQLEKIGFSKLILTPHIMQHRFPNRKKNIIEVFTKLQSEVNKSGLKLSLDIAAEYYYDEYFLESIENKELITFGDNYVLFELSYTVKPLMLEQSVEKLLRGGYKPILAHPERYAYYRTLDDYRRVKEMGLLFQVNAISMGNFYGKSIKKSVEMLINAGMADFIGSDIHSQKYLDTFENVLASSLYIQCMNKNKIKNNDL
jgi:tyrosine-protein phosphatase YwqE